MDYLHRVMSAEAQRLQLQELTDIGELDPERRRRVLEVFAKRRTKPLDP